MMITSPSYRQESRIKRLDLSGLSFKTISPRSLISPKKTPSEKESEIKGFPFERCLTNNAQSGTSALPPVDRTVSLDTAAFTSFRHETLKFRPIGDVINEDGKNYHEERYALPTPSSEKSARPKNNSLSTQFAHTKELHNQPLLGIRGSEIPNNGPKSPSSHENALSIVEMRKKRKGGLSMIVKQNEEFAQKVKGYIQIESPKSPKPLSFSPRVGSLASIGQKNMSHVHSARQNTQRLVTEEGGIMKTEAYEKFRDDVEQGLKNEGDLKDNKGYHKLSTNLQCFLETKMTWKGSLMKKPQYSLYQNIAQNRKARSFKLSSVDVIKGFCRGEPAKI